MDLISFIFFQKTFTESETIFSQAPVQFKGEHISRVCQKEQEREERMLE